MSGEYLPIRVSTLRGDNKIPFDAYVRVAGKYILLCRQGDSFEGERLQRLKTKKLQKMYINSHHLPSYNDYIRQNLEQAYDNNRHRPLDIRTQVLHGTLQAASEDLMEDLESQAFYQLAIESSSRFKKFFYSENEALTQVLELKNSDFSVSHHCVTVAALTLAMCESLTLTESRPMQIDMLTVGCLLHDLDHNFNNIDFSVPPDKLTTTEKMIHNRHAIEGAKRISEIHFYDPLVRDVVSYHEEKMDGSGQNAMRERDLDPLIFVVATANAFDHYITYENLNPRDALKKMLIDKMGVYPLEHMKALQLALKSRNII